MHKITKIQLQVKNKNRVNVYIGDIYSFSCDAEFIVKYKLKVGSEVDKESLLELIKEDNEKKAFQLAMYYLSFKSRTQNEITTYLLEKEYEDGVINRVLEKLIYYKYIDDRQYTINYISNVIQGRKKSISTVKSELIKKGISLEMIDELIVLFPSDVNLDIAKDISSKYFYQKSNLPFNQLKNKLSQLLSRKGFTWEVINECLTYLNQNSEVKLTIDSNKEHYELQAIELAQKYLSKYKKKENNPYLLEKKVKYALYQKGYDSDIVDLAFDKIKNNS